MLQQRTVYAAVGEYASRGSLCEVFDGNFTLDTSFIMSFAMDLTEVGKPDVNLVSTDSVAVCPVLLQGVRYIHSSKIGCHGNLVSSNCLIDGYLTLKISETGYLRLQETLAGRHLLISKTDTDIEQQITGKKDDIFGEGFILLELFTRSDLCSIRPSFRIGISLFRH